MRIDAETKAVAGSCGRVRAAAGCSSIAKIAKANQPSEIRHVGPVVAPGSKIKEGHP
jgi:hypothetical protein